MIIQCPSCQTKFAIDSAQLRNVVNPRFHCSRCDYFFELDEKDQPQQSVASKESEPFLGMTADDPEDFIEDKPLRATEEEILPNNADEGRDSASPVSQTTGAEQLALLPVAEDEDGAESGSIERDDSRLLLPSRTVTARTVNGRTVDGDEKLVVTASWPDTSTDKPREVDMKRLLHNLGSDEQSRAKTARSASRSWPLDGSSTDQTDTNGPLRPSVERARDLKQPFEFDAPDCGQTSDGAILSDNTTVSDSVPVSNTVTVSSALQETDLGGPSHALLRSPEREASVLRFPRNIIQPGSDQGTDNDLLRTHSEVSAEQGIRRSSAERRTGIFAPVLVSLSLPLLFCLSLWTWSNNLGATPSFISAILSLKPTDVPHIAPPGIELVDLSSQPILLDNGQRVFEVKGAVRNITDRTFSDVRVQANLFDDENQPIASLLVRGLNGLVNARQINSLSVEALETLQERLALGERDLKPSSEMPFRAVFTRLNGEPVWFAARIFSVR